MKGRVSIDKILDELAKEKEDKEKKKEEKRKLKEKKFKDREARIMERIEEMDKLADKLE